jgi:hypothetical protein
LPSHIPVLDYQQTPLNIAFLPLFNVAFSDTCSTLINLS